VSLLQQTRKEAGVKLQGMLVAHGYITKRGNKVVDKVEDICLLISRAPMNLGLSSWKDGPPAYWY
jgi:hypothetical protein